MSKSQAISTRQLQINADMLHKHCIAERTVNRQVCKSVTNISTSPKQLQLNHSSPACLPVLQILSPQSINWCMGHLQGQRNSVVWLQRNAKMEYFHQLLCKKSYPSHIWNTLKLATVSSAPFENWSSFNSNNPSSIANTLNSHFTSVSSVTFNPDYPPPPTPSLCNLTPTLSQHLAAPDWSENALTAMKPKILHQHLSLGHH